MKPIRIGIDKKLIFLFIVSLTALGITFGIYFIKHEEKVLMLEFNERARAVLNSVSAGCEYPILLKDKELLQKIVKGVLTQKDVISCEIKDMAGKVLFYEGIEKGKYTKGYTTYILTEKIKGLEPEDLILDGVKETEEIGKMSLVFSLVSVRDKLNEVKKAIFLIVIMGILLTSLLTVFWVRYLLTHPIKKLLQGIRIIAKGDLNYKVNIKTMDEIGELANAFNQMTADLNLITVSRDELNKEVIERKQAEEAIKKYSKELEEANNLKDLFSDILRHDLINPLSAATGYVEMFLEDEIDDEKKNGLKETQESLFCALDLIEQAKTLSKLDDPRQIKMETMDLKVVMEDSIKDLKGVLKEMEIENYITEDMPVMANKIIKQVFTNLISNAIKYAKEGKRIIVTGEDVDDFWRIKVIDFGEGIADIDKEAVFERFQRKEKKGVKGTGLGLAIAAKVINIHQGKIWVEDNPQGGAVFVTAIPKLGVDV